MGLYELLPMPQIDANLTHAGAVSNNISRA
jgi:hypothetical protein